MAACFQGRLEVSQVSVKPGGKDSVMERPSKVYNALYVFSQHILVHKIQSCLMNSFSCCSLQTKPTSARS